MLYKSTSTYISGIIFITLLGLTLPFKGIYISLAVVLVAPLLLLKPKIKIDHADYKLIAVLLGVFAFFIINLIFRPEQTRLLDRNLRWLLYVLIFLVFLRFKINHILTEFGIALGAILGGCFAIYEKIKNPAARAGDHINPIQFGSFSMLLSLLCIVILNYYIIKLIKKNVASNANANANENKFVFLVIITCASFGAAMGLLASIYSGSRGGWLSATLFIYIVFYQYSQSFEISKKTKTFILLAFAVLLYLVYSNAKLGVADRVASAKNDIVQYVQNNKIESSVGARLEMWRVAVILFKERPILGWGHEGYQKRVIALVEEKQTSGFLLQFNEPHNQFLDAVAKYGVLGIVLMFYIYFWPLKYFFELSKKMKNTKEGMYAIAGVVCMLAFFDFSLTHSFINKTAGLSVYLFFLTLFWALAREPMNAPVALEPSLK